MSLVGQNLGQYEIIEKIGAGGMATVYKAYQPGLDRYVAVKVLPAQHALTPGFKERFVQEAKVVAKLYHPNILPVYDVGFQGDLSYYVMRYVPGPTLRDLLGQPMDLVTVSHYIDQIAAALDHAHAQNIVHRDVKPTNILMENEWLLLADFGLAKILLGSQEITSSDALIGTPAYLSPEQAERAAIDHRADIYSLGVVLYEMVIGKVPFEADTPLAVLFKHIYEPVPWLRSVRPDLPAGVEEVIIKALAKDPTDRFERAGDLAEALRTRIQSGSVTAAWATTSMVAPRAVTVTDSAHIFICYKRYTQPDEHLATYLYDFLTERGHDVFIDRTLRTGDEWLAEIDQQIKASDFLLVLLSKKSADSEMVQAEVRRAYEYRTLQGRPHTLPIRVAFQDLLPYSIDAFLDPFQYLVWQSENDYERIGQEILDAVAGRLPQQPPVASGIETGVLSEDGHVITDTKSLHPPLPEFDPRFLDALEAPGGVVKLRDKFYIERRGDAQLRREVVKIGTTTTIRAPRQTGKSSLLVRGVNYARQQGARIVHLDLQRVHDDRLASPELFLRNLAELIIRKLGLDVTELDNFWRGSLGPEDKLTYLFEDYVLSESNTSIILALDEVDRLLKTPFHSDFFALLRSWHNSRALDVQWDRLNIVMVISTEPYLLINDVNQSPFNVGLKIYLQDFDVAQVQVLNQRHGSPVSDSDFSQLMELLGGQPYLTRKGLYTLVVEGLSWTDLMQVASLEHGPFGDHLRSYHWLLRNDPELQEALKQVIDRGHCSDEMVLFRLLQAGLVKGSGDSYTCRCDLYRMYFEDKLTSFSS